ncbi:MAG: hypothetical protein AAF658_19175, partial [Myxococcota bacterium]
LRSPHGLGIEPSHCVSGGGVVETEEGCDDAPAHDWVPGGPHDRDLVAVLNAIRDGSIFTHLPAEVRTWSGPDVT